MYNIKIKNYLKLFLITSLLFTSCNIKIIENYTNKSKKKLELKDKVFTTSDGYTIAYSDNELVDKPTLFFVHGFLTSRVNFFPLARKIKKSSFRLIHVDTPGFGESSRNPEGSYKITQQAVRLNELIDHLNLKQVHLVGTSMGGAISIVMNGMKPSILSSTLIAPFGMPLYTKELPGILNHFMETGEALFMIEKPYNEKRIKTLLGYGSNVSTFLIPGFVLKELKGMILKNRESTNKVGQDILYDKASLVEVIRENPKYNKYAKELNEELDNLGSSNSLTVTSSLLNKINTNRSVKKIDQIGNAYEPVTSYLEKINNPVLVIWGKNDSIINYNTMETMKTYLKNGEYKLLPKGAHNISTSKTKNILEEINKFFIDKKLL